MAAVPIFTGAVTSDVRLVLSPREREQRRAWLQTLRGSEIEMIVRRKRRQRSLDQNAYLHAVVFPILAREFGDSVEGVKFDLLGEKWGWTQTAGGRWIPVKPHTSHLTVEEAMELIEWVIPWALTTHGIEIPPPQKATAA